MKAKDLRVGDVVFRNGFNYGFTVYKINPKGFRDQYTSKGKCFLFQDGTPYLHQPGIFVKKWNTVAQWFRYMSIVVHRDGKQIWPEVAD